MLKLYTRADLEALHTGSIQESLTLEYKSSGAVEKTEAKCPLSGISTAVGEAYLQNFSQNLRGWMRSHAGREFWPPPWPLAEQCEIDREAALSLRPQMNKKTVARIALFAGCLLTAAIANATTYEDIAGQWCGDVTDYVFAPNTLTVKFHDDRPANVFKITKYTYTDDSVRIDWLNGEDKELVTVFAEFSRSKMAQQEKDDKPRRPFHRC